MATSLTAFMVTFEILANFSGSCKQLITIFINYLIEGQKESHLQTFPDGFWNEKQTSSKAVFPKQDMSPLSPAAKKVTEVCAFSYFTNIFYNNLYH